MNKSIVVEGTTLEVEQAAEDDGQPIDIWTIKVGFKRNDYDLDFTGDIEIVRDGKTGPWMLSAYLPCYHEQSADDIRRIAGELVDAADLLDLVNSIAE